MTSELPETSLSLLDLIIEDDLVEAEHLALMNFLGWSEGLEHLRLLLRPVLPTRKYLEAITSHKATLRTLVYHERESGPPDPIFPNLIYSHRSDQLLLTHDLPLPRTDPFKDVWAKLEPQCLGIHDAIEHIKAMFDSSIAKTSVKLLHVRHSSHNHNVNKTLEAQLWFDRRFGLMRHSPERAWNHSPKWFNLFPVFDFAQWAFGPDGLPHLQVLAVGDFSYDGRFKSQCLLLGRHLNRDACGECNFESIEWPLNNGNHSYGHFDGIEELFGFLGACPRYTLLGQPEVLEERGPWPS